MLIERPEKHKLGRGSFIEFCSEITDIFLIQSLARVALFLTDQSKISRFLDLAFCPISPNFIQQLQRRSRKCLSQSVANGTMCNLLNWAKKNTHKLKMVEDIEYLLPVKICQFLFFFIFFSAQSIGSFSK